MAWFGLVVGQLHALARHQTADGKADLRPAADPGLGRPGGATLFAPLLDWADPDAVYLTYGKLWLPVFVAFTLCAFVVHRRRRPQGFEKWAWRVALTGYCCACVSVVREYWTQWGALQRVLRVGLPDHPARACSDRDARARRVLGIAPAPARPPAPRAAWLLTLAFPLAIRHPGGHLAGQHRSCRSRSRSGSAGRRIARGEPLDARAAAEPVTAAGA